MSMQVWISTILCIVALILAGLAGYLVWIAFFGLRESLTPEDIEDERLLQLDIEHNERVLEDYTNPATGVFVGPVTAEDASLLRTSRYEICDNSVPVPRGMMSDPSHHGIQLAVARRRDNRKSLCPKCMTRWPQ